MSKLLIDADGIRKMKNGYVAYVGTNNEYVHTAVAAAALGRALPPGTEVHHANGDKTDNRNANLVICPNHAYHMLLHSRATVVDAGGDPNTEKVCGHCKKVLLKLAFSFRKATWDDRADSCRDCTNERRRGKGYGVWNERRKLQQQVRRARV